MGYRGEDVPGTRGDWGRQPPWQPSSGAAPGSTGAGESQGYPDDESYPNDGGYGYGPDGGYPGQGQQGYAPPGGQYGDTRGQSPYEQSYDQYDGYGSPQGYPRQDDHGYEQGRDSSPGYGYDQRSAPGRSSGGGYQDPSGGYPAQPGSGGYPAQPGSGGYPAQHASGGYPQQIGSGGYPAQHSGGGYPALPGGSGGYPALPAGGQGGYSTEDAGNDWYGGQPAAANGASFADTGTYRLNGSVIDEYGTGPREAMRDPVRGYPPGPGRQGSGPLPRTANPSASGPQSFQGSGPQAFQGAGPERVAETRAQRRYDEGAAYPELDRQAPGAGDARGGGRSRGPDAYAAPGYGGYDGQAPPAAGDEYAGYGDGFNGEGQDSDPYQDLYSEGHSRRGGRGSEKAGGRGWLRGKRLLFSALGVVVVGVVGVAAYAFVFKSSSPSSNPAAQGSLSTAGATPSTQACVQQFGTYCHIEAAADDPTPLTTAELYSPAFTDETDKISYQLAATKADKTCKNAVIGSALIQALQAGKCTQVLRGSYVSGNNKIMGTIGVMNLSTTNEAHHAGKVVGQNDFIAPLTSSKGVARKLGNGTGVVEAEFKGHYLILTWSEFVNGANPATKTEQNQLMQFSNDVVGETANIDLSQRMVTGAPPSPGAPS